jgi:hypothetical protein
MLKNYKVKVLFFIILIKVLTFLWLISLHINFDMIINGFWGTCGMEDWSEYLQPVENLIFKGSYSPDLRTPGYGLAFLIPRLLFDRATACNILIIFQLLMGIISAYLLAQTAYNIYKTRLSFILTGIIYSLCLTISSTETRIGSDSLAISFSIFAVYFLLAYLDNFKFYQILLSTFFICWTIFIRPIMGILWAAMIFYLVVSFIQSRNTKLILPVIIFIFSFIVLDSVYMIRNYRNFNQLRPLGNLNIYYFSNNNFNSEISNQAIVSFVTSWGGDYAYWDPSAEIRWFGINERNFEKYGSKKLETYDRELPDYIYTSEFNKDSLLVLKNRINKIQSRTLNRQKNREYCAYVNKKLFIYTNSVKKDKPLIYYIYAPLRITAKFVFNHGTQGLIGNKSFNNLNLLEKILKISVSITNLSIVIFSIFSILFSIIKRQTFKGLFIPLSFVILYVVEICCILRSSEIRYKLPVYPFLFVYSISLIYYFKNKKESIGKTDSVLNH